MAKESKSGADPFGWYPFWFWNDDLSEEELRWQIAEMRAKGVRGFFIHSRQGLKQPYLSAAFLELVEAAVAVAEDQGLVAHLYDEYPYPSGVAGGEVVLGNPHFYATELIQRTYDVPGGRLRLALAGDTRRPLGSPLRRLTGKVLNCMAYPLTNGAVDWTRGIDLRGHVGMVLPDESYFATGTAPCSGKRYFASNPTPTIEAVLPDEPHRVFVSRQRVVECMKYWGHFVDVLNPKAIRQFLRLTHERYRSRLGKKFGKVIHSIFVDETEPSWSERVPEAFQNRYGYDLLPLLPALQDSTHPQHLKVKLDLHRLVYDLFCRCFEEPVSNWCARHRIRYCGEKPSLRLSQLRYMDIPGCDAGHTKAGAKLDLLGAQTRGNARAAASAAYFYGKEGALCECYHSLGWGATLQDIKLIAEGLLLMGIRYLVPHAFFYSTHALRKHDAPPSFFFQMPYWPLFGELSTRIESIGDHFEGTYIDAKILVVEPTAGLPTEDDLKGYRKLLQGLLERHLDFLLVDTDILQSGRFEDGHVRIRDIRARVVIVPPMQVVEQPLLEVLDAFERAGGAVIRCGGRPERDPISRQVLKLVQPRLHLSAAEGDVGMVHLVTRSDGQRVLWFLLNTGAERLELDITADCALREIPLGDNLPAMLSGKDGRYARTIHPFESVLLQQVEAVAPVSLPQQVTIPVRGPAKVVPLNRNLLRMYDWEMALLGEDRLPLQTAAVPAVPLANQIEKGGFRISPIVEQLFGSMPELRLPPLHVRYRFRFQNAYDGRVELVMEPGSIVGEWRIQVNDAAAVGCDAFGPTDAHVRGSLGVDITRQLRMGPNEIVVEVRTDRMDGGLLNALYLAGDFGVALDPLGLVRRPETGGFETHEANGLPHYAGVIEYETSFQLDSVPATEFLLAEIDCGVPFEDACEVAVNAGPWRPVLWSPRCVRLPSSELTEGLNTLRLRVYTTLSRSFEGWWFDIEQHSYREVGCGND